MDAHINTTRMATLRANIIKLEEENNALRARVRELERCLESMEDERQEENRREFNGCVYRELKEENEERTERLHEQLMAARFHATLGEDE